VATVALLAGCGSDEAATTDSSAVAATTGSVNATTTTTSDTTVNDAPAPTDQPPATDPPRTDAPAATAAPEPEPDDSACLVGDWVVTEEQMDAFYDGVMSTLEAPLTIDTVGSAPLSFAADGTYLWAPAFALTVEVAGASGTGDVTGTITGNWTAVDGVVTTSSDLNALVVSLVVNGVPFEGADLANGLLNGSPVNGVTYSCDGPTPVLDFQTADPSVTVPVTLTPA
jgi:hypothetical protein